jgi:hypothetical protein
MHERVPELLDDRRLIPSARAVGAHILCRLTDGPAELSRREIGAALGLDVRTVRNGYRQVAALGYFKIQPRSGRRNRFLIPAETKAAA